MHKVSEVFIAVINLKNIVLVRSTKPSASF